MELTSMEVTRLRSGLRVGAGGSDSPRPALDAVDSKTLEVAAELAGDPYPQAAPTARDCPDLADGGNALGFRGRALALVVLALGLWGASGASAQDRPAPDGVGTVADVGNAGDAADTAAHSDGAPAEAGHDEAAAVETGAFSTHGERAPEAVPTAPDVPRIDGLPPTQEPRLPAPAPVFMGDAKPQDSSPEAEAANTARDGTAAPEAPASPERDGSSPLAIAPKAEGSVATVPGDPELAARVEVVPIAVPVGAPVPSEGFSLPNWTGAEWLAGGILEAALLFFVLLVFAALARALRRTLPSRGALPSFTRTVGFVLRISALAALLLLVARVAQPFADGFFPWLLAAATLAVGWSLRDILPDVVAAVVLRFENRLRAGVWVAVANHEGVVERLGSRALWLRDPHGDRLAIPNRTVLTSPLQIQDKAGAIHEVTLRLPLTSHASTTRLAILEAVVTSPYVSSEVQATIRRDGTTPDLWHVRARLLHERYALQFEGELLERSEDALQAFQATATDSDLV